METPQMSQKLKIKIIGIVSFILVIVIYGIGVLFYQSHFLPSTTSMGFSIANQTVETANQKLETHLNEKTLLFRENQEEIGYLQLDQIGVKLNLTKKLTETINRQSPMAWPLALLKINRTSVIANEPDVVFNEGILKDLFPQLGIDNEQRMSSVDASIKEEANQFIIEPEVYGTQIDEQSLSKAIVNHLNENDEKFELETAYIQPKLKQDDVKLRESYDKIAKMVATQLTLTFDGHEITIPKETINHWIFIDEHNEPQIDKTLVEDYIRELNYSYAGLFQTRIFTSTYQGDVVIQPGTYGWYIDRHTESDAIIEDIKANHSVKREPIIGGSGYGMGDYVGNSYVEVDIANQMMMIYLDGVLALQTPVVTGLPGTNTVPGAYQVWNMEAPSVLVGYNPHYNTEYQQPVSYWIAFDDQAQGIHDANWQGTFGGTAYLTSGSLGCVNTPPSIMPQVYELVYYGMPVIIF